MLMVKLYFTKVRISALKSSLKTAKRLQLDWTKTAKDWTCSIGLSVSRLEDCKKTGFGGPILLVKTGLWTPLITLQTHLRSYF